MSKPTRSDDFNLMLAQRIMYQLTARGIVKVCGETMQDVENNIGQGRLLILGMLKNGSVTNG